MLAAVNFNASTGALTVIGDNLVDDTITLTGNSGYQDFTVTINNDSSLTSTFNYSDVTSVKVFGGTGDDTVVNTLLIDTEIFGQGGDDRLEGGYANDLVVGGTGIDILVGRNGDDVLNGEGGNDSLFGGNGNDALSGLAGNDRLFGGEDNDILNGYGGDDVLHGEAGDDSLLGGAGIDLLLGQAGNDTLRGEGGDDRLVGGDGNDALHGDAGVDELLGQAGDDILFGGDGNDFLWGSDGEDTLRGNAGHDRLYGGADNDHLLGDEGVDIIRGDGGNDVIRGGDGDDSLYGLGGTDILYGDAGDDLLDAGGDVAADVLTGGSGLDQFVVLGHFGSSSVDVIADLEASEIINGDVVGGGIFGDPTSPAATASIGDLVFEDTDGDGVLDSGEEGIGDVTLTLFSGADVIATQTTDASGQYKFENLPAGDYRVELTTDLTFDYDLTTPTSVDVTLADGQVNNSVDFGAQALPPGTASIGDLVFYDANENGSFDAGEQGIGGVVVNLIRSGIHMFSQTTDSSGHYEFTELRAASYDVVVDNSSLPSDRVINDDSIAVTLADGEQNDSVDFSAIEYVNPVDLALLIPLFGAGLTDFVSSIVFEGFVDDETNVTSVRDVTIIDTDHNRILFRTEVLEDAAVPQVRMVGTLPLGLPDETALALASSARYGETLHVAGPTVNGLAPVVSLDGLGSGQTIGSINSEQQLSTLGHLSSESFAALTEPVIAALASGNAVQLQSPATPYFLQSVQDGTQQLNEAITLDDGRILEIKVSTDVTTTGIPIVPSIPPVPFLEPGNIEFDIRANQGNVKDVHVVQFYEIESKDAQDNPRVVFLPTGNTNRRGEQLFVTENEIYLDVPHGNVGFYDFAGAASRSSSSLLVWDDPMMAKVFRPDGGTFTIKFTSYVVVGSRAAYEVNWQVDFSEDVVQGAQFVSDSYNVTSAKEVNGLPERFNRFSFPVGYNETGAPARVTNPAFKLPDF